MPGRTAGNISAETQLRIAAIEKSANVGARDRSVTFPVDLKAGKTTMQTWFLDEKGKGRGAYYAYVKRLR